MEKLAIGLVIICLLYVILLFGFAYCLDHWYSFKEKYQDKLGKWYRGKVRSYSALREMIHYLRNDNSRKAGRLS